MNAPSQRPALSASRKEISVLEIWQIVYEHKFRILTLALLAAMLAYMLAYTMPPVYRATSTLLIEPRKSQVISTEELFGLDTSRGEYLATQFALLKSRSLASRVRDEYSIHAHPEFLRDFDNKQSAWKKMLRESEIFQKLPIATPAILNDAPPASIEEQKQAATDWLLERIHVSPVNKTQLVKISIETHSADLSMLLANAFARHYIEGQLEAKLDITHSATTWMNNRLLELKKKLKESENRLQSYRETEDLVDLKGVTTLTADSLSDFSTRLSDARKVRAEAESQFEQVRNINPEDIERLSSVPAVLANSLTQQFKADLVRAKTKLDELARRYGPKHPKMIAAVSDVYSARNSLRQQVSQVVSSIEKNYQLAVANESALNKTYQVHKNEIQDISKKEFRLRELQLEVDTNRSLYNTFVERLKETSAVSDLDPGNARIVDLAILPSIAVKPQKLRIALLTAIIVTILASGILVASESLDNTIESTTDAENKLNIPVVGTIPSVKSRLVKRTSTLITAKVDRVFAESIRSIRTNVLITSESQSAACLVVTSSVPQEGKSTLSSNLAIALSQLKPTLLLDGDMRKPSVAHNFKIPTGMPGLANLIAGNATMDECIYKHEELSLISAGDAPPNPLELLSSERFSQLITELKNHYDYIVIDTPPVGVVSDALMIAPCADMTLYVVRSRKTAIETIKYGLGKLYQGKVRVSGVAINHVDMSRAASRAHNSYDNYGDYYV